MNTITDEFKKARQELPACPRSKIGGKGIVGYGSSIFIALQSILALLTVAVFAGEPKEPCDTTYYYPIVEAINVCEITWIELTPVEFIYYPVLQMQKAEPLAGKWDATAVVYYQNDDNHNPAYKTKWDFFSFWQISRTIWKNFGINFVGRFNDTNISKPEGFIGGGLTAKLLFTNNAKLLTSASLAWRYREFRKGTPYWMPVFSAEYHHRFWKPFSFVGGATYEIYTGSNEFQPVIGLGVNF